MSAAWPPASTSGLALLGRAVEAGDGVAGVDQVDGHRAAHDAEADEGDVRHVVILVSAVVGAARGRLAGSQPKLSAVVVDGLYSRPTQPA